MLSGARMMLYPIALVMLLLICSAKSEEAPISEDTDASLGLKGKELKEASIPPEFWDCINLGPENTFMHTDSFGNVCEFQECPVGNVLDGKPTCPPDTSPDVVHMSSCRLLKKGKERMPFPNHCKKGVPCKVCLQPWSNKSICDIFGESDTVCECTAPGYYLVEGECVAKPTCDKGSGLELISGEGSAMECRPCKPGFFQPDDNSTQSCRSDKHWTLPSSSESPTSSEDPSSLEDQEDPVDSANGNETTCIDGVSSEIFGISMVAAFVLGTLFGVFCVKCGPFVLEFCRGKYSAYMTTEGGQQTANDNEPDGGLETANDNEAGGASTGGAIRLRGKNRGKGGQGKGCC